MNHKTLLASDSDAVTGTFLVGHTKEVSRDQIQKAFGGPTFIDNDPYEKVTVEWVIQFDNGTLATIYDWKRYELGTPAQDELYEWHIGGVSQNAVELVNSALERVK